MKVLAAPYFLGFRATALTLRAGLHSLRSFLLLAAPYRACIRSAHPAAIGRYRAEASAWTVTGVLPIIVSRSERSITSFSESSAASASKTLRFADSVSRTRP